MNKGALISEDDTYRYKLWRIWDNKKPIVLYIMLNPSIADDNIDDPTIKTLIRISQNNGFGGFYVGNLSPYRATNPTELNSLTIDELIPVENYSHIEEMIKNTSLHILAHGDHRILKLLKTPFTDRFSSVIWYRLKQSKQGNPRHPLYLKSDVKPEKH